MFQKFNFGTFLDFPTRRDLEFDVKVFYSWFFILILENKECVMPKEKYLTSVVIFLFAIFPA